MHKLVPLFLTEVQGNLDLYQLKFQRNMILRKDQSMLHLGVQLLEEEA